LYEAIFTVVRLSKNIVPSYPYDQPNDRSFNEASGSLADLMTQVSNIMLTLDNATMHITFNDSSMLNFVAQLNTVKDALPQYTPPNHLYSMQQCLRNACKELTLAAVEYQKRGNINRTFLNCVERARAHLSEILLIRKGF
jgi:hypothetical protein